MTRLPNVLLVFFTIAIPVTAQSPAPHDPAPAYAPNPAPDDHLYRNPTFGFRYQIPFGWVDRTRQLSVQPDTAQPATSDPTNSTSPQKAPSQEASTPDSSSAQDKPSSLGQVFLAIFERPPDAPGATINSAVVIAAEPASAYPGLKKAEDYLAPLTELTSAKGFKGERDPEDIQIDSRQLIRADFSKPLRAAGAPLDSPAKDSPNDSAKNAPKDSAQLTMHQSTLILLTKGQILSFTFIAGSDDEIDDLIEGLHFSSAKPGAH